MKFSLRRIVFITGILPCYFICMFMGLIGYDKLAGNIFSNFYIWAMK